MSFDFDQGVDRRGSDSMKWQRYGDKDVLPLWVADMDFAAPPAVLDALHRRIDHGVFGYAVPWPSLINSVTDHLERHYDWQVDPSWIVWIPGVVAAFNAACRAVGIEGDKVFTATPVYPPFLAAPRHSGRELETLPLVLNEDRWEWDFDQVDAALARSRSRLWLLCHPHNPVGRVWDDTELAAIGRLAEKHDLVICSDEIHCGLVLDPTKKHRPLATLSPEVAKRTITLMAPSKTFNIPGLYSAFAIIPDAGLRRRFHQVVAGIMPHINTLGLVATEVAYRDCDDWQAALIDYLRGNEAFVRRSINAIPGLRTTTVEATYLAWIDCGEWLAARNLTDPHKAFEAAGVGLSNGRDFALGSAGAPFVRLNFGCPRSTLEEALRRMAGA